MYRQARRAALPPQIARLPRILPLSRLNGATPTRAAAWRRVSEPSKGLLGQQGARAHRPDARHRARQLLLGPPGRALPDRPVEVALDPGQRLLEPAQVGVDPLVQGGIGRVAPVALGDQHLEQLTAARHQGAEVAGGLEHDQRRREGGQALDQGRHALVVVADREALAGGARVDVEPTLGDVDADERGSLVHDPVSLDAGLLALVTVRVAGTRPAGRHVLARPSWTRGTAGSRRPTRSRYQIGSRQHTKWDNG